MLLWYNWGWRVLFTLPRYHLRLSLYTHKHIQQDRRNMRNGSFESHLNKLLSEGYAVETTSSNTGSSELPPCPTISRAPRTMHRVHPRAYEPELVSIGPVHLSDVALQPMLRHKLLYYLHVTENVSGTRTVDNNLRKSVDTLVGKAKQCYQDNLNMSDSDFSLMLALDGCFILELFRRDLNNNMGIAVNDPIFDTRWMIPAIRLDLIKLENQIPFFILEELYNLTRLGHDQPSLVELAVNFLDPLVPGGKLVNIQLIETHDHSHLLALFHSLFNPESSDHKSVPIVNTNLHDDHQEKQQQQMTTIGSVGSVTELQNYRVYLKKVKRRRDRLLDINFNKGTLEIPPLLIDHNTVSVFQNLAAYEQCNKKVPSYFTSYIVFFNGLVNSPEDVDTLRGKGILNHTLGSDNEVAEELNNLSKEIAYDGYKCHLSTTIRSINTHKNWPGNKLWAKVIYKFFPTSERYITFLLTLLALYLTAVQTSVVVLSYDNQKP